MTMIWWRMYSYKFSLMMMIITIFWRYTVREQQPCSVFSFMIFIFSSFTVHTDHSIHDIQFFFWIINLDRTYPFAPYLKWMIKFGLPFAFAFSYVRRHQHTKHNSHFTCFRFAHVLLENQHYIDRVLEPILQPIQKKLLFAINCLSSIMCPVVLVGR